MWEDLWCDPTDVLGHVSCGEEKEGATKVIYNELMSFFLALTKMGSLDLRVAPDSCRRVKISYLSLVSPKSQENNY